MLSVRHVKGVRCSGVVQNLCPAWRKDARSRAIAVEIVRIRQFRYSIARRSEGNRRPNTLIIAAAYRFHAAVVQRIRCKSRKGVESIAHIVAFRSRPIRLCAWFDFDLVIECCRTCIPNYACHILRYRSSLKAAYRRTRSIGSGYCSVGCI